jgi:nucleotide-binding universal stress UspA family protein
MKRILVGVDGSPESKQAAEFAAGLADALKAKLTLVYVAATPIPFGPEIEPHSLAQWEIANREYGSAVLREMAARCARTGLRVETRLEAGPPAETLAHLAGLTGAGMIAVGHRGRSAGKRFLLGSVADRLAQISPGPVLICRG